MARTAEDRSDRTAPRGGLGVVTALAVALLLLLPAAAGAAVPFKDIASGGPLTHVSIGNELSCQVAHTGDAVLELYPSSTTPGSCGTFIVAGDALYAPDFANHGASATSSLGAYTPFTPVSQSEVSGTGRAGSPFKVTTVAGVGATGLRITQVDTYIAGQESYRTDVTIQNTGGAPVTGNLYRAGDCYLQGTDVGFGFVDSGHNAPGCAQNANNAPAGRIEQWFPITGGNQYLETSFSEGWAAIGSHQLFPNTCRCTEIDRQLVGAELELQRRGGSVLDLLALHDVLAHRRGRASAREHRHSDGLRAQRPGGRALQPPLHQPPALPDPPAPARGHPHRAGDRLRQRPAGRHPPGAPRDRGRGPPGPAQGPLHGEDHDHHHHRAGDHRQAQVPDVRATPAPQADRAHLAAGQSAARRARKSRTAAT